MSFRSFMKGWLPGRAQDHPIEKTPAVAADQGADEYIRRAREYQLMGRTSEAQSCFRRALELKHDAVDAHIGLGSVHEQQDEFEDAADCYRLAACFNPHFAPAHHGLAAVLTKLGRHAESAQALRDALEHVPGDGGLMRALAGVLQSAGDEQGAVEIHRQIVALDPGSAAAHGNLCRVLNDAGLYAEARARGARAVELDANLAEAHHNLALSLLALGDPKSAEAHFQIARRSLPDIPEIAAGLGHAYRDLGRFDEAVRAYDDALKLVPGFGDAAINRAYALLARGDGLPGWVEYEKRFVATGTSDRDFGLPLWQGESLAGKTILVYAEQGLGDEIMFASCIPELAALAGRVIVECDVRLAPLLRRSFPGVTVHGGSKDGPSDWLQGMRPVDFRIAIGSLPLHFRARNGAVSGGAPYLIADASRIHRWLETLGRLGPGLKVGLSWKGGTRKSRGALRSMPLESLSALTGRSGVVLVSLQHKLPDQTVEPLPAIPRIHEFPGLTDDIEELAALMRALDLVITVDNTNAHLAGALGAPVWIMMPPVPEWRYGPGETTPWYASARLYRCAPAASWESLAVRIAGALDGYQPPRRALSSATSHNAAD
jgi:tetratricopeptide (TPR) repeat protein